MPTDTPRAGTLVTIVGARPQFIKAAVVSRALRSGSGMIEVLVHTGQHYDRNMSDVFFRELALPEPDHHLGVGSGSHAVMTARMLEAIEQVLVRERPHAVLVYGDTNSTLAGALAASKLGIPVAHVEAGVRSFNRLMAEEINRVLTDHCADLLLAPTVRAVENLRREGIPEDRIELVGDVMYDAALSYRERALRESRYPGCLGLAPKSYLLATMHRAENTDHPRRLEAMIFGLARVATELPVVMPLHPRTRKMLTGTPAGRAAAERLRIIDPVGYLDMIALENNARVIATDSGGVQKEAFFYRVPCVTLRTETEWTELTELGWNTLVDPTDSDVVAAGVRAAAGRAGDADARPFGDGDAGPRVVRALTAFLRDHLDREADPASPGGVRPSAPDRGGVATGRRP
jgi:UDP-GlcNAc3NAcA epimerase